MVPRLLSDPLYLWKKFKNHLRSLIKLCYIVEYQETNEGSGTIQDICLKVPLEASDNNTSLWLIPAGQYLKSEYYKKLSQLDWNLIFSEHRNGVAFFQQFLACIEKELQAEYVIIDSRTGITEIAGLCTQQLADEVIILSSLSGESIKLTKHIKQLILKSKIAKALEKSIEVKVIASRVPKPDDLDVFKEECCRTFEIEDNKLFFLFSSQVLERKGEQRRAVSPRLRVGLRPAFRRRTRSWSSPVKATAGR